MNQYLAPLLTLILERLEMLLLAAVFQELTKPVKILDPAMVLPLTSLNLMQNQTATENLATGLQILECRHQVQQINQETLLLINQEAHLLLPQINQEGHLLVLLIQVMEMIEK